MLKRLILSLALAAGLLSPAYSAGTIPLSLSQQFDTLGKPLANCYLYTIQAGTTSTPQNAYSDSNLTIPLPNPQRCDSAGRLPQFFLADGSIKVRLTDVNGVTQIAADGILVIGPSAGGGGGSSVDPTTILATGDLKVTYGTGVISGFVRANGRTIGSATSGATERANADCLALFEYLWTTDPNLVVSTGRGVSAAADWAANKTIALPDWRGRVIAGLDDMGSSAAGRLTAGFFGTSTTTLGSAGGFDNHTLTAAEIPAHTHPLIEGNHSHNTSIPGGNGSISNTNTGIFLFAVNFLSNMITSGGAQSAATGATVGANVGGGGAHTIVQPTMLATIYMKL